MSGDLRIEMLVGLRERTPSKSCHVSGDDVGIELLLLGGPKLLSIFGRTPGVGRLYDASFTFFFARGRHGCTCGFVRFLLSLPFSSNT